MVLCLPPQTGSGRVNPLVIFRLIDALTGRQSELRDAYRHLSLTPSPGELGPLLLMQLAGICGRPVYSLHDPALLLFAYSNGLGSQRFIPNTSAPGHRHSRIAAGLRCAPELPVSPVVHPTF